MEFKKAERRQQKLKIAFSGPSGSGKTFSSLKLATGFGAKKIAVADTENGSASLYADAFNFDALDLKPPYTTDKFIEVIKLAVEKGYDWLIIDSISHQWKGEGGVLNRKEQVDARGGNSFTNWSKFTPEQERFVSTILNAPIHIICTVRSKQEYAMSEGDKGKTKVQKLGMAPVQREGIEYEFTVAFDAAMNHEVETSKDRTGLFAGKIFKVTEDTGKTLKDWLESGKPMLPKEEPKPVVQTPPPAKKASPIADFMALAKSRDYTVDDLKELVLKIHNRDSMAGITPKEIQDLTLWVTAHNVEDLKLLPYPPIDSVPTIDSDSEQLPF